MYNGYTGKPVSLTIKSLRTIFMEKELYKALALVLLEPKEDSYGNIFESPLKEAINTWSQNNREKIITLVMEQLKNEDFAEKVANNIKKDLSQ